MWLQEARLQAVSEVIEEVLVLRILIIVVDVDALHVSCNVQLANCRVKVLQG
jgi:hypothetical protein